jgi:hypothetical protein
MMPVKFALIIALLNLLPMVVVGLLAAGLAGALTGRLLKEKYRAKLLIRDLLFALAGMMATVFVIVAAFYQTDSLVMYAFWWRVALCWGLSPPG